MIQFFFNSYILSKEEISVNNGQIILKFSSNINVLTYMSINTIYFITNKIKSKECESKIQLYGNIKVHSFSITLEDIKFDRIYYKTKSISQFSYVKSCSGIHVHVNLVAGLSAHNVWGKSTTFTLFAFRYVVVLARLAGAPSCSNCMPLWFLNNGMTSVSSTSCW